MNNRPVLPEDMFQMFTAMPAGQLVFIGLFAATWLIGGNVLVALHYKRLGKPWYSSLKPFAFPFKDFNSKEWLVLVLLAGMSLCFGMVAVGWNGK